jgi:4'-phosphopantetheinyl transferase EntD
MRGAAATVTLTGWVVVVVIVVATDLHCVCDALMSAMLQPCLYYPHFRVLLPKHHIRQVTTLGRRSGTSHDTTRYSSDNHFAIDYNPLHATTARAAAGLSATSSSSSAWVVGNHFRTVYHDDSINSEMLNSASFVVLAVPPSSEFSFKMLLNNSYTESREGVNQERIFKEELQYLAGHELTGELPSDVYGSLFIGGRIAVRRAASLSSSSVAVLADTPILKHLSGAPALPSGILASVSHKSGYVAAYVATPRTVQYTGIGIDIELTKNKNSPLFSKRVLTDSEIDDCSLIQSRCDLKFEEAVMLRFSAKEAVYKAINPLLNRFVGFKEVELLHGPHDNERCGHLLVKTQLICGTRLQATCNYVRQRFGDENYWITRVICGGLDI